MKNYQSPLSTRYGSETMRFYFSDYHKFTTWRKVWVALAKSQQALGYPITDAQINQLETYQNQLNLEVAQAYEAEIYHDVMAQLLAYGDQVGDAKGILHLGATSAFVSDNAEILIQKQAMTSIFDQLIKVLERLSERALDLADVQVVGFTHYQVAQPTTLGKRLTMYVQDLMSDVHQLQDWFETLTLRGVKGTTGTAASFLDIFEQDQAKVFELDNLLAQALGIQHTYAITGQTYPRKRDNFTLFVLSEIAMSAHKLAVDFRLMQHDQLVFEPFRQHQVGSSAMPYKRNPILSEKISGLARKVMVDALNGPLTAANQWLERSLDDSSNRRLVLSEAFLIVDEILTSLLTLVDGFDVNYQQIEKQLHDNLPLVISEPLLMAISKKGHDRQVWHEEIRTAFLKTLEQDSSDIISHLRAIENFPLSEAELKDITDIKNLSGLAQAQTRRYIKQIKTQLKEIKND